MPKSLTYICSIIFVEFQVGKDKETIYTQAKSCVRGEQRNRIVEQEEKYVCHTASTYEYENWCTGWLQRTRKVFCIAVEVEELGTVGVAKLRTSNWNSDSDWRKAATLE